MRGEQIVSLEELLPHLRPAGLYFCEDVTSAFNEFSAYACGLAQDLNSAPLEANLDDNERRSVYKTTPFQSAVSGAREIDVVASAAVLEPLAFCCLSRRYRNCS